MNLDWRNLARRLSGRGTDLAGPDDVRWCYRLFLGREPDAHGERGYLQLIRDGHISREELTGYFLSSPEFRQRLVRSLSWAAGAPQAVTVDDRTYYVDPGDAAIGAHLRESGAYEPAVTAVVQRHLRPGQCFVDIGASFGYFSVLAGTIVGPAGRVAAFEPGPQNQSLLLLNLAANHVTCADVHQMALAERRGICMYSHSGANGFISAFTGDAAQLATHSLVQVATLDTVLGDTPVDMMKIDVEGAEGLVFAGAERTLERFRPMLLFEFSPPSLAATSDVQGRDLLERLAGLGYSLDVVEGGDPRPEARSATEILDRFEATPADHIDLVAWT